MSASDNIVGIFMGLSSSSYEYTASLISPYRQDLALRIGSLLLIQGVDGGDMVARVVDYQPRGEMISAMGMKWLSDMAAQGDIDSIGSDIKKSKISYSVKIKVLGSFRGGRFAPGLKTIPHITSKVSVPDHEETKSIIQQAVSARQSGGTLVGHYDLRRGIEIFFDQQDLSSKRTFIFARAGFGKSNLMKVICGGWRAENGGLIVFDADGEYAITDARGRPGVMDRREAILLTNQRVDPNLKNVYRSVKLNLAEMPHELIIPQIVNPDKHEMIFFAKLMAMPPGNWPGLVKLLYEDGWGADMERVGSLIVGGRANMTADEARPILNNLVRPIRNLHDGGSDAVGVVTRALREGRVVIFDISRIGAQAAREVSSIMVRYIFNENRRNFIQYGGGDLIRTTFVLEEAHTVLSGAARAPSAFVELAKEGRKYGLGGIFITQQPGSIPAEIVSQGDNFFVFHLLSRTDLESLSRSNAHYSDDIITQILSEPLPGKCYMWTSRQPFVIPVRVSNFEDPENARPGQSVEVQNNAPVLDGIMRGIRGDKDSPERASIYAKYIKVEEGSKAAGGAGTGRDDLKSKSRELFEMLDEGEKEYLRRHDALQPDQYGRDKFFAVRYSYYHRLQSGTA